MGLDNCFVRACPHTSPDHQDHEKEWDSVETLPSANMVGLFGPGGSFRGKCYTTFFSEKFGVDLYKDMPPEKIKAVSLQLREYCKNCTECRGRNECSMEWLAQMFEQAAIDNTIHLIAWY